MHTSLHMRILAIPVILLLLLCGCGQNGAQPAAATETTAAPDAALAGEPTPDAPLAPPVMENIPSLEAAYPENEPTGAENEVRVSNVDEFLAAIRPDTAIYLEAGDYDLSLAQDYGSASASAHYAWIPCSDGYELQIHDVENLQILGHSAATVTIRTPSRYASVLAFVNCGGVSVKGVTAGHTEGPGYCSGAVIFLDGANDTTITQCLLYGCGTLGVYATNATDTQVIDCTICDCSLGAVQVINCRNTLMQDCLMSGCGTSGDPAQAMLSVMQSAGTAAVGCTMQDSSVYYILQSAYGQNVSLLGCTVTGNDVQNAALMAVQYSPVVEGCAFVDNQIHTWYADDVETGQAKQAVSQANEPLSEEDLIQMQQRDIPYALPSTQEGSEPATGPKEVHVSSVDELLAAIASDTTVYLEDGDYNLSQASDYGISGGNYY